MVKLIKNTSGAAEAEQRLVATMYNIERGALAVDDRGQPRPAPHAPYPVLEVPAVTKQGMPVTYHLKPAVGIVFYTAGPGFQILSFVTRVRAGLAKHGYGHLTGYRTVAITPCATVRKVPDLVEDTAIAGPRKPHTKGKAGLDTYPARLLLYTPPLHESLPSHISYRAGFTWVFMSIGALVDIKKFDSAAGLNAAVASVLYDDAGVIALDNGAEFYGLAPADIVTPALPEALQKAKDADLSAVVVMVVRKGAGRALELAGSIPGEDAGITRVLGNAPWATFEIANGGRAPKAKKSASDPEAKEPASGPEAEELASDPEAKEPASGPEAKEPASDPEAKEPGDLACLVCAAPLWGEVYVIVKPKMPKGPDLDGAYAFYPFDGISAGAEILDGYSVAVCKYCARNICGGLAHHLDCMVARSRVPRTHDEAFGEGRWRAALPLTQAGAAGVTPVFDMPGYFQVGTGDTAFVLKPAGQSSYSYTAIPQISSRPIFGVPNLVEARGP